MKIHPSALIDPKAKLADDVEIGPFCVIGPKVEIGAGTKLANNVTVSGRTTIGAHNDVSPFAVIGGKPQDLKYKGEDSQLVIGDHNTIREFVTVNIGTAGGGNVTRIGSHIVIANNMLMGGHVKIDDWAGISGYVGLHHFLTVGRHAYVGGYTRANVDIPPFMIVTGIPMNVVAPNFVGLKRRGYADESIMALKDAHRLIWRSGLPKSESIAIVEQRYPKQVEVRILLDFLHATDKGKLGRARDTGANGHGEGDEGSADA